MANTVSSTSVTAAATDPNALSVVIKRNGTVDSDGTVNLEVGDNTITVEVTAEDGTMQTYTVTVNRPAAAPTITAVAVTSTPLLTSSGGSTPDTYGAGEDIEFTVTFNEAVEVTGDPQFGFTLSGARVADYDSGSGRERLTFVYTVQPTDRDDDGIRVGNHASVNPTLQLDADDAITSRGGTDANLEHDSLDRLDDHKVDGSRIAADATLSGLVVNDGSTDLTLSPGFASGTTSYTASVGNTVAEVTVTPTKNDTTATIEYLDASDMTLDDADTSATGQQVTLAEGDNVINVKVTAADSSTTLTYTVTGETGVGGHAPDDLCQQPGAARCLHSRDNL